MRDWPVFILTLPGDDKRRMGLEEALADAGLAWELYYGIDGRDGLPAEYEQFVDRQTARHKLGRDMSDGELACALSHRAIYQTILQRRLPGAIILEDDARPTPAFVSVVKEKVFMRAPITLFHHSYGRAVRGRRTRLADGVVSYRAAQRATSTMAYALRSDAAQRLLDCSTPVSFQADWPCDLYELNAWLCVPRLFTEAEGNASHLQNDREAIKVTGQALSDTKGFRAWLRRRFSVRVGREKGER